MSFSGWKHSFAQFSAKYSSHNVDVLPQVHDNSDYKQVAQIQLISSSFGKSCNGCIRLNRVWREKKNYFWLSCYPDWGWKYKKDKWRIEDVSLATINTSRVEQPLRQKAVPHHHRLPVPFISLCWLSTGEETGHCWDHNHTSHAMSHSLQPAQRKHQWHCTSACKLDLTTITSIIEPLKRVVGIL